MKHLKPIIIIGILALSLALVSAAYRFQLSQYEEECYQYTTEKYLANLSFPQYADGTNCYFYNNFRKLNCSIKYIFYNSTRFTDKCSKYHLVRKA